MKTLCELKRKEIARQFEAVLEAQPTSGYLCRDCLRYSNEKKRLCEPVSIKKILVLPTLDTQLNAVSHSSPDDTNGSSGRQ